MIAPTVQDQPASARAALEKASAAETGDAHVYLALATEAVAAATLTTTEDPWSFCRAQLELGNAQRMVGDYVEALSTFERAIVRTQDLQDDRVPSMLGLAYHRSAIVYDAMGNLPAALERLRKAHTCYHQAEDDTGRRRVENSLGVVYSRSEDYQQALTYFQSSFSAAESRGDRPGMCSTLSNISIATRLSGDIDAAVDAAERSLALADNLDTQASCTTNLALALAGANRFSEAEAAFERGAALHEALGDPAFFAEQLRCHAKFLLETDRPDRALPLLERSLALAEGLDAVHQMQEAHLQLYRYWKVRGDHTAALLHHEAYHDASRRSSMDDAARELRYQKAQQQVEHARQEAEAERRVRERLANSYAELTKVHHDLSAQTEELQRRSRSDGLTGLANRQHFDHQLVQESERSADGQEDLGLLLLDLDAFKSINDRFGHPLGDEVLRRVAAILLSGVRGSDLCGRLGGEEFGVLLTRTSPLGVAGVAEKLRREVAEYPWNELVTGLRVTTSIGGALLSEGGSDALALFSLADARLYRAKHGGRDRVVVDDEDTLGGEA